MVCHARAVLDGSGPSGPPGGHGGGRMRRKCKRHYQRSMRLSIQFPHTTHIHSHITHTCTRMHAHHTHHTYTHTTHTCTCTYTHTTHTCTHTPHTYTTHIFHFLLGFGNPREANGVVWKCHIHFFSFISFIQPLQADYVCPVIDHHYTVHVCSPHCSRNSSDISSLYREGGW